jgi:hypothetical protein
MWNTAESPPGARRRIRALGLAGLFFILLARCKPLLSFEYLDVSCSVNPGASYYSGETVSLDFSIMPDRGEAERTLILTEGGLSRGPAFRWEGRTLHLKPLTGWKKGEHYGLSLEGKLPMEDGRTYTVQLLRNFIYGLEGKEFTLVSSAVEDDRLVFIFSQVPGVTSFSSQFSLSPSVEYFCDFLEKEIRILPKSPWQANTLYRWTIKGMESGEGYHMKQEYSGVFSGPADPLLPRPLELCPVNRSLGPPYLWKRGTPLDGKLENMEGIGFIFSKPMDQASLRSGISFYPSIKGYFEEAGDDSIIFFPEEEYRLETEYRISIAQTVKDSLGLSLFEEARYYFSSAHQYLQVEKVSLDSREDSLQPGGGLQDHSLANPDPPILNLRISFSSAIPPAKRRAALESVSLSGLFPASAGNPALISAKWEDQGAALILVFEGLSLSGNGIDNYYQLKIGSGEQGPLNGEGEYLKEDLWYVFRVH